MRPPVVRSRDAIRRGQRGPGVGDRARHVAVRLEGLGLRRRVRRRRGRADPRPRARPRHQPRSTPPRSTDAATPNASSAARIARPPQAKCSSRRRCCRSCRSRGRREARARERASGSASTSSTCTRSTGRTRSCRSRSRWTACAGCIDAGVVDARRREQLLARAVAGGRGRARLRRCCRTRCSTASSHRKPDAELVPYAPSERPPRDRVQPARHGTALGPLRRRPTRRQDSAAAERPAVPARERREAARELIESGARSRAARTTRRRRRSRWRG